MKLLAVPVLSLLFAFLLAGCDARDLDGDPDAVLLRVENASSADFSSVRIGFDETENYGAVASGQTSEYRAFDTAYSYGYVEVEAGDRTYRIQPIDYVGEEPLENGHYTYELDIEEGRLTLAFDRD